MFPAGLLSLSILALSIVSAFGYDPTRSDNLVVYWGQDSYGQSNPNDPANWQQTISTYCQDTVINAIPIAFVDVFSALGVGGLPEINLANTCNPTDDSVFAGSELANCQFLAAGIEACQALGKIVTISLGGQSGAATFANDAAAEAFADQIWNLFLGGSSSTRPFGAAVLDGVDLDIEGGGPTGFAAFVTQLRTHTDVADKTYYVTAAPQCPFPDAYLGTVINAVGFDAIYVQFYNNYCGVDDYSDPSDWDFSSWDTWAKTTSPNPDVRIFIGAPASASAGAGYVAAATLGQIAISTRAEYSSFGGIMLWDASQAFANDRFDEQVKDLIATGTTTTTTKTTTSSTTTSKTSTTTTTSSKTTSKTSTTTTTTSSTKTSTTTTSSTTSTVSTGSCAGVAAWSSTVAYLTGSLVTYDGDLWENYYWSEADVPGGASGDWENLGACSSLVAGTAKVAVVPAASAQLTGAAPAASASAKSAPVETGEAKRENSRAFRL
ncbi:glycoside hydrolase superfamily [Mycena galopus ATCC 62051]|nr:glycoside hydrolase superfamily [Mycena galopus ATCC 62051]